MKVSLCKLEEIPNGGTKTIDFFGREVLVFNFEGIPKAVINVCVHLGGPLERQDDKLLCAWHNAEFSCDNGHQQKGPRRENCSSLIFLPTRIEDNTLNYVYGE